MLDAPDPVEVTAEVPVPSEVLCEEPVLVDVFTPVVPDVVSVLVCWLASVENSLVVVASDVPVASELEVPFVVEFESVDVDEFELLFVSVVEDEVDDEFVSPDVTVAESVVDMPDDCPVDVVLDPLATWKISTELVVELDGTVTCPWVKIAVIEARPPTMLPAPSSAISPKIIATSLPLSDDTSISLTDILIADDTKRCSSENRLPPP